MFTWCLLVGLDAELCFHIIYFLTLTVIVKHFLHFCLLIVQNNQISVAHVKARQVIHCVLRVVNVFVDNKGSATSVLLISPES